MCEQEAAVPNERNVCRWQRQEWRRAATAHREMMCASAGNGCRGSMGGQGHVSATCSKGSLKVGGVGLASTACCCVAAAPAVVSGTAVRVVLSGGVDQLSRICKGLCFLMSCGVAGMRRMPRGGGVVCVLKTSCVPQDVRLP